MANWEYNTFQITQVTNDEHIKWKETAYKRGYRTLSAFLRPILERFKPNKGESTRGNINISVCSYDGLKIKKQVSYGASPQVRKHINDSIKKTATKGKNNEKSNRSSH